MRLSFLACAKVLYEGPNRSYKAAEMLLLRRSGGLGSFPHVRLIERAVPLISFSMSNSSSKMLKRRWPR